MITDDRMTAFIRSLEGPEDAFLGKLETDARSAGVPVIRPEMKSFLRVLIALHMPKRILEVGTAVGFSALLMAMASPEETRIVTIEREEERIREARKNFLLHPAGEKIELLSGDAAEILPELEGPFDMIFMDAAKGQYIHFLPDILRLLPEGGLLVSDNVLQEGDIIESHFAVERRNRTIYKRMREYLFALKNTNGLLTSIVPIADGAAVSVKMRRHLEMEQ